MKIFKSHRLFLLYILMFFFAAMIFKSAILKADEADKVDKKDIVEKVYKIEVDKSPNFLKVKEAVLSDDIKYVVHPNKLNKDIELSEIIEGSVDYSDYGVQEVDFEVLRYIDSKSFKTKIDTVKKSLKIQFVDTIAPKITLAKDKVKLEEEKEFNPKDYLEEVVDNSFDKVQLDIENKVNTKKPGKYEVVYTAVDKSNNKSSEILNVEITAKPKPKPAPKPKPKVVKSTTTSRVTASATPNSVYGALDLINSHRSAAGLHPLRMAGASEMAAASLRAAEASQYVSHTRLDGRSYKTAFTDRGLYHNNVIEVLTYSGSSAADKVNWWMNSSTHRNVLMRSNITHIAFGVSGGMWSGIVYQ